MSRQNWTRPTPPGDVIEHARLRLTLEDAVGLCVRAERRRRNLSGRALAVQVGCSPAQIQRIEARAGDLRLDVVSRLLAHTEYRLTLLTGLGRPDDAHEPHDPLTMAGLRSFLAQGQVASGFSQVTCAVALGLSRSTWARKQAELGRASLSLATACVAMLDGQLALVRRTPEQSWRVVSADHWPVDELLARVRGGSRRFPGHVGADYCIGPWTPDWWIMAESSYAYAVAPEWTASDRLIERQ